MELFLVVVGSGFFNLETKLGHPSLDIGSRTGADGIFGKATQAAVEQYQRDRGLPVTGVWDEKAQAAVTDATGEQAEELTESSVAQRLGEIALELAQIASQLS